MGNTSVKAVIAKTLKDYDVFLAYSNNLKILRFKSMKNALLGSKDVTENKYSQRNSPDDMMSYKLTDPNSFRGMLGKILNRRPKVLPFLFPSHTPKKVNKKQGFDNHSTCPRL